MSHVSLAVAKQDPDQPEAFVTATANRAPEGLGLAIRDAFQDAMAYRGRLRDEAFRVNGFSGRKFRLFINNLISEVEDARYLEIGVFHGASFCAALFKNKLRAVAIDNWAQFGGKREPFMENIAAFRNKDTDIEVLERDFRKVDFDKLGKFNILFYDGSHEEQDQYDGVLLPQPALDDHAIIIVDDWNWDRVRKGTFNALRDAHVQIDYSIEVRTSFRNEHLPRLHGRGSEWHNGCFAAAVSKVPARP